MDWARTMVLGVMAALFLGIAGFLGYQFQLCRDLQMSEDAHVQRLEQLLAEQNEQVQQLRRRLQERDAHMDKLQLEAERLRSNLETARDELARLRAARSASPAPARPATPAPATADPADRSDPALWIPSERRSQPAVQLELARTYAQLALLLHHAGQTERALGYCTKALTTVAALVADPGLGDEARLEQVRWHNNLGLMQQTLLRYDSAVEQYQLALQALEGLPEHAKTPAGQHELAGILANLAGALMEQRYFPQAQQYAQRAVTCQIAAVRQQPTVVLFRQALLQHALVAAEVGTRAQDAPFVFAIARQLAEAVPDDATGLRLAAGLCGRAIHLAIQDQQASREANLLLRRDCEDAALRYLDRAIALGYRDGQDLESHADFRYLRTRPGFRELLRKLRSSAPWPR